MIIPDDVSIYLVTGVTDLRKGIDSYALIVQDKLHLNPYANTLYLFSNKQHNKLKILYWDKTGFWLLYHRLEHGHYKWIKDTDNNSYVLDKEQFNWLMQGIKIEQKTSIKKIEKNYV